MRDHTDWACQRGTELLPTSLERQTMPSFLQQWVFSKRLLHLQQWRVDRICDLLWYDMFGIFMTYVQLVKRFTIFPLNIAFAAVACPSITLLASSSTPSTISGSTGSTARTVCSAGFSVGGIAGGSASQTYACTGMGIGLSAWTPDPTNAAALCQRKSLWRCVLWKRDSLAIFSYLTIQPHLSLYI